MLLNDARRDARVGDDGAIVLLADQDRSRWDDEQIARGREALGRAGGGPYSLQARVGALHCDDPPDWRHIASLYAELARLTGSPVVELNRAVAVAEAGDVAGALALVDALDLDGYHYLHATRAELLRRLGREEEARAAYDRALERVSSEAERRFLQRRRREL